MDSERRAADDEGALGALSRLALAAAAGAHRGLVLGGSHAFADRLIQGAPHLTVVRLEGRQPDSPTHERPESRVPASGAVITRPYQLASLDWWDLAFGSSLILLPFGVAALNAAKVQYLYKAMADRLEPGGVFAVAEALPPGTLLHHLIWMRHAGLVQVDCVWRSGEAAVFAGEKSAKV